MSKQLELPTTADDGVRSTMRCEICKRPAIVGKNHYHLREIIVGGVVKAACRACCKEHKR